MEPNSDYNPFALAGESSEEEVPLGKISKLDTTSAFPVSKDQLRN